MVEYIDVDIDDDELLQFIEFAFIHTLELVWILARGSASLLAEFSHPSASPLSTIDSRPFSSAWILVRWRSKQWEKHTVSPYSTLMG